MCQYCGRRVAMEKFSQLKDYKACSRTCLWKLSAGYGAILSGLGCFSLIGLILILQFYYRVSFQDLLIFYALLMIIVISFLLSVAGLIERSIDARRGQQQHLRYQKNISQYKK